MVGEGCDVSALFSVRIGCGPFTCRLAYGLDGTEFAKAATALHNLGVVIGFDPYSDTCWMVVNRREHLKGLFKGAV